MIKIKSFGISDWKVKPTLGPAYCSVDPMLPSLWWLFSQRTRNRKWLVWTLTASHRLEGQDFPFSRIVLRSWRNCGAAAALTVLEAQSFLGGTKIKFMASLGRVINFKFQKSTFCSGSDAVTSSCSWWSGSSLLLPSVIWCVSPPPLSLDCDRIWVPSFHRKGLTSVFKNSLIKSEFVLISSQFSTMEKFLEDEMRWPELRGRGEEKAKRHQRLILLISEFGRRTALKAGDSSVLR